ncbi:MAG: hypothetical protein ABSG65_08385 [Bryobacteraceae bacterium]
MTQIEKSPVFGGGGGKEFNDYTSAPSTIKRIALLKIRSGNTVDSIQATYELENGELWEAPAHGGDGGKPAQISLQGQELISVLIRSGNKVDQLRFAALEGKVVRGYGPYGGDGGGANAVVGNVVALFGRSGARVDAIGLYGYNLMSTRSTATIEELAVEAEALRTTQSASLGAAG